MSKRISGRVCARGPIRWAAAVAICNLVEDRAGANECWWMTLDRAQHLFNAREKREELCDMFPAGQRQQYCHEKLLPNRIDAL